MKTSVEELLYLADQERHDREVMEMMGSDDYAEIRTKKVIEWAGLFLYPAGRQNVRKGSLTNCNDLLNRTFRHPPVGLK